jgi:hypothetical protein
MGGGSVMLGGEDSRSMKVVMGIAMADGYYNGVLKEIRRIKDRG